MVETPASNDITCIIEPATTAAVGVVAPDTLGHRSEPMTQPSYFRTISLPRHRNRGAVWAASQSRPGVRRVAPLPQLGCFLSTRANAPTTSEARRPPNTGDSPLHRPTPQRLPGRSSWGHCEPPRRSHSELTFRLFGRFGSFLPGWPLMTLPASSGSDIAASMTRISSARPVSGHVKPTGIAYERRHRGRVANGMTL